MDNSDVSVFSTELCIILQPKDLIIKNGFI